MTINRIDQLYRSILLSRYFVKGWGKPDNFKQLFEFRKKVCNRKTCYSLVSKDFPVVIDKKEETSDYKLLNGHFISPFGQYLPDLVPENSKKAYFQVMIPKAWEIDSSGYRPMVLHMAGTGDHYFWRRRNLIAKPLLKESNIGSIILENPFYGTRKPDDQVRSILHNVSDIFVMGGCLMLEALVLFHWCEREGFGPLGVTGLSMGGHMASLAATNWPKPLVLVPCLSWSTASGVFTEGVLSGAIPWDLLEDQYRREHTYRDEIEKMMTLIDEQAYMAGERFAQTYPSSLIHMEQDIPPQTPSSQNSISQPSSSQSRNSTTVDKIEMTSASTNPKSRLSQESPHHWASDQTSTNATQPGDAESSNPTRMFLDSSLSNPTSTNSDSTSTKSDFSSTKSGSNCSTFERSPIPKSEPSTLAHSVTSHHSQSTGRLKLMTSQERYHLISMIEKQLKQLTEWNDPDKTTLDVKAREAFHFMRGIMNQCTHLANFSPPVDTGLIIAVCARDDGYVPQEGVMDLRDIWPGAEVRYIDGGHVQAFLMHQKDFRNAIRDGFERARVKNIQKSYLKEAVS